MSAVLQTPQLTRDQLRERIDTLELAHDLMAAIEDVQAMQADPDEQGLVDITVTDRTTGKCPVAFVHALPAEIVIVMLRAAQAALEEQLQMEKV
jgi:hypothetical protein